MNLTAGTTYTFSASSTGTAPGSLYGYGGEYPYYLATALIQGSSPSGTQVAYVSYETSVATSANGTATSPGTSGCNTFTYTPTTSGTFLFLITSYEYEAQYYGFTYNMSISVAPPKITSLSVTTGPGSGGTTTVITGTGFTGAQASWVMFGSVACSSITVNAAGTQITAVTPAQPGNAGGLVDVTVVSPTAGPSPFVAGDKFTYTAVLTPTVVSGFPYSASGACNGSSYWYGTYLTAQFYQNSPSTYLGATSPQSATTGAYPYSWAFAPQNFYSMTLTAGNTYTFTAQYVTATGTSYLDAQPYYMINGLYYSSGGSTPAALTAALSTARWPRFRTSRPTRASTLSPTRRRQQVRICS